MSSGSKRKLSEIDVSNVSSTVSPPYKKPKHDEDEDTEDHDKIKTVIIGNQHKLFSTKLLSNLAYFEARLSDKWNNTKNDDEITISVEDPFIFSMEDFCTLLSCFNNVDTTFIIPSHLLPQTTFLSFMQCANFFCVNDLIDAATLMSYYNRCDIKIITMDTLMQWKTCASNIPQIVQFASNILVQRQNMTLESIANILRKCQQNLRWSTLVQISARKTERQSIHCDESVIKHFDSGIDLLLRNYDNESNLNKVIAALKGCVQTMRNQLRYIAQLAQERNDSNQVNRLLSVLLKLLSHFTKSDKHFEMIQEPIMVLMITFCDTPRLRNNFDRNIKRLWGEIVLYIFKTASNQQLIAKIIDKTLCVFVEDENIMKEILGLVNNKSGQLLALGMMEYDLTNDKPQIMLQQKYSSFCSKFFNPTKPSASHHKDTHK